MAKQRKKPRAEVQAFSMAMEEKLIENDHKGGWKTMERGWLLRRLSQELGELRRAIKATDRERWPWLRRLAVTTEQHDAEEERIVREAADVANFAMMLADVSMRNGIARRGAR